MRRSKLVFLAATSVAAVVGTPAFASESALQVATVESVTVMATRTEAKVDAVPATVSVITAEDIEDQLIQDAKDLVRFEPGVAVRTNPVRFTAAGASTGRDGDSGFNIRGLEGNRVLILADGVRVPDAYSFGAQSVGRGDYTDLDMLKSVEIVRGPASALYGSDGLAGAVSFTTKDPSDFVKDGRPWFANAKAGYASADKTYSEGFTVGGVQGRWQGLIAYTRRDGEGRDTAGSNTSANTDRTTPNPEDNSSNALVAKLIFSPLPGQRLRLTFDRLDRDVDWTVLSAIAKPPLISTSTVGLTAFDRMERNRITLDHRYQGAGFISAAQTAVYYQDSKTRQYSAEDRNTAADRTRDATFNNTVWGGSLQLETKASSGGIEHHFVYGGDYSLTRQEGLRNGTVPPAGETFPTRAFPTTESSLGGVFIQDEITLAGGRLGLYPALRYDYYKIDPKPDALYVAGAVSGQSDSHVTPKFGAVLRATDQISLFANLAQGFKAPAPSQVNNGFANLVSNYRSASNPNLRPETSRSAEAGVRYRNQRLSLSGTVFAGAYNDFIDQVQVAGNFTAANPAVYQFINRGSVKISGVEARGQADLGAGFGLQAAASYTRGTSKTAGVSSPLDSVEPLKLVAGLNYRVHGGRYGGALTAVHSDGKERSRVSATACSPTCYIPSGFTVLDLTAFWAVTDKVTVRGGVFNLTDESYAWWSDVRGLASTSTVTDAYTQPGRNYSVSLGVKF